jgi:hypothetical protein
VLGNGDAASIAQFDHFFVDDQVVYVLFAYTTEEEAYGRLVKRVLITFVGPKVKPYVCACWRQAGRKNNFCSNPKK